MALNLLGSGFGNQNYTPVNPNAQGPLTNLIAKYGKDSITRTRTISSKGSPVTRTVTRTVAQPEIEYAKYQGPEETTDTIPTKAVFGTTPKQRQQYVREVQDYNRSVQAEKKKVADYNKEVEQWNKSGRFTKVTRTYTETPTVTKTITTTIPLSKPTITTTTTKPTVTTKTLTSKERLDAIAKPDYLQDFADRKAEAEKPTLFTAIGRRAYDSPLFGTLAKFYESVYKESKLIGAGTPTKPDISKSPLISANRIINEEFAKIRERANLKTFLQYDKAISPTIQKLRSSLISPPEADVRGDLKKLQDTRVFKALGLDNPPLTQEKAKAIAKAGLEKVKDTEFQAKVIVFTGETIALPFVLSQGPQIFTSAKYRLFGTRVPPETLYSPIAMKSSRGLDLTYNPEKTIKAFKKTYGKTPELPNQYVAVTQSRSTDLGSKVLTRAELASRGIKQGSEPGLFVSPLGAGQTGFLGISDDVGYKLTLDPRKILNQGQPTTFKIGFKEIGQYPKSILNSPLSQAQLEAYQISQASKSKVLITRMSSLGTKFEPEGVSLITARLAKVKTPLYFTEIKGTIVPVKTIKILGTGDSAKNLISGNSVFRGTQAYESLKAGSSRYIPVIPSVLFPVRSSTVASEYKSSLSSLFPKNSASGLFSTSKISTVSKIDTDEPIIPRPNPIPSPTYKSETSISKIISTTTSTLSPLPAPTYTSRTPSRPSLTPKYRTPTGSRILRPVIPKDKQKEMPIGEPAYDVLIKVGNKWVNRTNGKRNIFSAMHRGADIVDNTTAKSFKIKKGTGRANIFKYNVPYNINKFYTPSKTRSAKLTGAYIEKSRFAIDTPGERRGLSVAKYLRGVKLI